MARKTSPLFDEIYAVGDSLSDSGGIFELSSQALDSCRSRRRQHGGATAHPSQPALCAAGFPTDRCSPRSPRICSARRSSIFRSAAPRRSARRRSSMPRVLRFPAPCWRRSMRCRPKRAHRSKRCSIRISIFQASSLTFVAATSARSALGEFGAGEPDRAQRPAGPCRTFDPNNPLPLLASGRRDRSGQSCRRLHRLRPWDRHGYPRDAARDQFLPGR